MAVEQQGAKIERAKYPFYVSKQNGSIHPAQTNVPGYEDRHPDLFMGVANVDEAKRYVVELLTARGELGGALDAMVAVDTAENAGLPAPVAPAPVAPAPVAPAPVAPAPLPPVAPALVVPASEPPQAPVNLLHTLGQ
jgi:hypothetical protein